MRANNEGNYGNGGGFNGRQGMIPRQMQDGEQNYDNPDVINIREQLGDFDYDEEPAGLGRRELREMMLLENGAKYEGEWLIGTHTR